MKVETIPWKHHHSDFTKLNQCVPIKKIPSSIAAFAVPSKHNTIQHNTTQHNYIHTCMYACMHTYIHPRTHARTYIRTYVHTYIHAYMHTCIHPYIHTSIHPYIHTYIRWYSKWTRTKPWVRLSWILMTYAKNTGFPGFCWKSVDLDAVKGAVLI